MDPNPIVRVLSVFLTHQVKALLIGGQACIFYGAAEFSRDVDYAVWVNPENLLKLKSALEALGAERIRFWLMECRTPDLLISLRKKFPSQAEELVTQRPLLARALPGEKDVLRDLLKKEEEWERKLDEAYWAPLRKELEWWRRERARD